MKLVRTALAVSSLLVLSCATAPPPKSQPSPLLDRVMPSFEGVTLSQNEFFSAKGQGHPMVVNFFSTDCGPCKATLTAVQNVASDEPGVVVVGISTDDSETTARRFVNELEVRFPVIVDRSRSIARTYHVERMPMTFVISPNGNIRWVGGPEQTEDGLRAALNAVDE